MQDSGSQRICYVHSAPQVRTGMEVVTAIRCAQHTLLIHCSYSRIPGGILPRSGELCLCTLCADNNGGGRVSGRALKGWGVGRCALISWPDGLEIGLALPFSPVSQWRSLPVWPQFPPLGSDENINLQSLYAVVRISSGSGVQYWMIHCSCAGGGSLNSPSPEGSVCIRQLGTALSSDLCKKAFYETAVQRTSLFHPER